MDEQRCPYCVERNGFKLLDKRQSHLICVKCGHVVMRDQPEFLCPCPKCVDMRRPLESLRIRQQEARRKRA